MDNIALLIFLDKHLTFQFEQHTDGQGGTVELEKFMQDIERVVAADHNKERRACISKTNKNRERIIYG